MIHDVDESLRRLIRRDAINGADVDVVFDAPTKEWANRRNAPTLDVYLYDIREDLRRRSHGSVEVYDEEGFVSARHGPPRYFKLSYLMTAWTQRPEDEHRLLSAVLSCFLRFDALPVEVLNQPLADQGLPVRLTIALPPSEDRALSDVWSALGGELKPSLDLVVTAAVDTRDARSVGPPVLEEPRFSVRGADGQSEEARRPGRRTARNPVPRPTPGPDEEAPQETTTGGTERQPGRIVRMWGTFER